ncbi:hypothetical protein BSL82_03595 [Tardibacter chloracetimidivorans]|uniref:Uncharacterized protein n=1 Tax=Tardibacter chloracetimidivorans TaxID=1921510 RepID=A0A1L3ZS89_9SPHN|nr:hypothetical protein [Tardibacter chloracetimidivorans]API58501.1 hypothetical protein BSL82_03595 [Tardibacter chloracetimidivorans]
MTNQPDDLVERLLTQADGSRTPSLLKEAAARIKELKAEVEILQCLVSGGLYSKRKAAEDRAAKAEEALRKCRDQLSFYGSGTSRL